MSQRYRTNFGNQSPQARGYVSRSTPVITPRQVNRQTPSNIDPVKALTVPKAQMPLKDRILVSPIQVFPIPKREIRLTKRAQMALVKVNRNYALVSIALVFIVAGSFLGISGFKANQQIESKVNALVGQNFTRGNYNTLYSVKNEVPVTFKAQADYIVAPSSPRLLRITSIGLSARVKRVTVNEENILQPPDNIFDVGWYDGSTRPGESGAMLINGYINGKTKQGSFFGLDKLQVDAKISLECGDGRQLNYAVVAKEAINKGSFDLKKAIKPYLPDRQGLNMVTYFDEQSPQEGVIVYAILQ